MSERRWVIDYERLLLHDRLELGRHPDCAGKNLRTITWEPFPRLKNHYRQCPACFPNNEDVADGVQRGTKPPALSAGAQAARPKETE